MDTNFQSKNCNISYLSLKPILINCHKYTYVSIWVRLGKLTKPEVANRGNSIPRLTSMSSNGAGELLDGDGPDRKKIKTSECVRLVIYTTHYCSNLTKSLHYFILYCNKDPVTLFIYAIFRLPICVKNVLTVFIFHLDYKHYPLTYSEELIINRIALGTLDLCAVAA